MFMMNDGDYYGITMPGYGEKLDLVSFGGEEKGCGSVTVVNRKGQLVSWERRLAEGLFIDEVYEDWQSVVVPEDFVPEGLNAHFEDIEDLIQPFNEFDLNS